MGNKNTLIFGLSVLISACGQSLSDESKIGAFGMPIPANVELWRTSGGEAGEVYQYKLSSTYEELIEWYSGRLIRGQDLGSWKWCNYTDGGFNGSKTRFYKYINSNGSSVSVGLMKNAPSAGGTVAISISEKKRGASYADCER